MEEVVGGGGGGGGIGEARGLEVGIFFFTLNLRNLDTGKNLVDVKGLSERWSA